MGAVYDKQKRYVEALDAYKQALEMMRQVGDRSGEATVLSNVGLVFSRLARFRDAQDAYHQALAIYRTLGERPGKYHPEQVGAFVPRAEKNGTGNCVLQAVRQYH